MTPLTVLTGSPGVGAPIEGEALVSAQGFNARYDLDRARGILSRPAHDLYGRSCAGKILVFAAAKGGIAASWALYDLKARGYAPAALVFRETNPVMVQGAVLVEAGNEAIAAASSRNLPAQSMPFRLRRRTASPCL